MRLNEIYEKYRDHLHFLCVYIKEAHPTDGWLGRYNQQKGVLFAQPNSLDERAKIAEVCVLKLNLKMPMVLDDMTNSAEEAYKALPDRFYIVNAEGRIAWRGEPGPWGFDVDAWESAILGIGIL